MTLEALLKWALGSQTLFSVPNQLNLSKENRGTKRRVLNNFRFNSTPNTCIAHLPSVQRLLSVKVTQTQYSERSDSWESAGGLLERSANTSSVVFFFLQYRRQKNPQHCCV